MIITGDCRDVLKTLPADSINCCITSPPYFGLRDYGVDGQMGLEKTPSEFVEQLVSVFAEVKRTLKEDGTVWLNLGDSYANDSKCGGSLGGNRAKNLHGNTSIGRAKTSAGLKAKDLIGIPWMVAFAMRADGWHLRQDIIWHKPNAMPESVRDRCTKAHEYLFLLSKSPAYFFDHEAFKEPAVSDHPAGNKKHKYADLYEEEKETSQKHRTKAGLKELAGVVWETRNRRSVWSVTTKPFKGAHFATFPTELITPCVLAGCPSGGTVLDPFAGAGTTGLVCRDLGREFIGIELNPDYATMARDRIESQQ